jgi:hypothetical protein
MSEHSSERDDDPRPVTDGDLREEFSREEVEQWRREADEHHSRWFTVLNNAYGKD